MSVSLFFYVFFCYLTINSNNYQILTFQHFISMIEYDTNLSLSSKRIPYQKTSNSINFIHCIRTTYIYHHTFRASVGQLGRKNDSLQIDKCWETQISRRLQAAEKKMKMEQIPSGVKLLTTHWQSRRRFRRHHHHHRDNGLAHVCWAFARNCTELEISSASYLPLKRRMWVDFCLCYFYTSHQQPRMRPNA